MEPRRLGRRWVLVAVLVVVLATLAGCQSMLEQGAALLLERETLDQNALAALIAQVPENGVPGAAQPSRDVAVDIDGETR